MHHQSGVLERCAGIVLCGGASRRMGTPKHLLKLGDETFLERIVRTLRSVLPKVVVVAGRETQLPELPDQVTFVRDQSDFQGPLTGLREGLAVLQGTADVAFVSACDAPLIRPEFAMHMLRELHPDDDIAVPLVEDQEHPLGAAYRVSLLPRVDDLLKNGERRLIALLASARTRRIPVESLRRCDPLLDSLRNVNSLEDYASLLQLGNVQ